MTQSPFARLAVAFLITSTMFFTTGQMVFAARPQPQSVNCTFPGVVHNVSSRTVTVRYDTQYQQGVLADVLPGQWSTVYSCDVDQFTVWSGSFQIHGHGIYPAGYFYPGGIGGGSIGWMTWTCVNAGYGTSGVYCYTGNPF
jgi:hypothetical protein